MPELIPEEADGEEKYEDDGSISEVSEQSVDDEPEDEEEDKETLLEVVDGDIKDLSGPKLPKSSPDLSGLNDEEIAVVLRGLSDEELEDLFNKNTESFQCLAQILISRSSLLRHILYHFPELKDPGIDEAFNTVEPEQVLDNIGGDKYIKMCNDMNIVPISRVTRSLDTDTMNLKYYGLTEKQFKALAHSLTLNVHLKNLILEDNWMTPESAYLIGEMLRENNSIRVLNLKECRIGPQGMQALVDGLSLNQSIEEIDLSFNELGDEGLAILIEGLKENPNIKKLNLGHNNITEQSGKILGSYFNEVNYLDFIDLSWNDLYTNAALKPLCAGFMKSPALKYVNLAWNGIGTKEAVGPIVRYLKTTEILEHLDISCNRLMDICLKMIKAGLVANNSLISINLGFNLILPDDALMLIGAFQNNKPLQYMDLQNVFVTKSFVPIWLRLTNSGKSIRIEGVLNDWMIHGPDKIKLLFDRCRYLGQKPKKKKKKKDFGSHFIYNLPQAAIDRSQFQPLIKKSKIKLDSDLVNSLADAFQIKRNQVNLGAMQESYLNYYPDTQPPPPKKKKGGKGKKGKKGKKKTVEIVTTQPETEEKGVVTDKSSTMQKSSIVFKVTGQMSEPMNRPSADQPEKMLSMVNFEQGDDEQNPRTAKGDIDGMNVEQGDLVKMKSGSSIKFKKSDTVLANGSKRDLVVATASADIGRYPVKSKDKIKSQVAFRDSSLQLKE